MFLAQVYRIQSTTDTNEETKATATYGQTGYIQINSNDLPNEWKKISEDFDSIFVYGIKLECEVKATTAGRSVYAYTSLDSNTIYRSAPIWNTTTYETTKIIHPINKFYDLGDSFYIEIGVGTTTGVSDTFYIKNKILTIYYSTNINDRNKKLSQSLIFKT